MLVELLKCAGGFIFQKRGSFDKQRSFATRNIFLATAFAASMALALTTAAEAKVVVYFGTPYYDHQFGPDYRFREGHGWNGPMGFFGRGRLSCGGAKWRVRSHGFRNVSTIECDGRTYTFKARRGDNRVVVYVNSRTGAVWRG